MELHLYLVHSIPPGNQLNEEEKMGDTNVQTSGVGGGAGHHHQLHHHQLHHHASSHAGVPGSGNGSVSSGHHHHSDAAQLSFGLGFFPDPSDMSSKSLPPFSSFGEADGLMGEGLSGRLLDLGGVGNGGGPPPWDLYGEGLSARLIDVGAPTPLGLGIGVGVGLGLGFAPPPPSAVPANGAPPGVNGTGPGGVQYRPWESKNHPDGPNGGNPPTLLELGRMMAVSPPPSSGSFTELQLLPPPPLGSPKLPSFQSQFQHSYTSSPSPTTVPVAIVAQPPTPSNDNGFLHHHNNNNNSSNNNNVTSFNGGGGGGRYPVVPAPVHPHVRPEVNGPVVVAPQPPSGHPGAFVHHAFPATTNHHYASLPAADPVSGYQQQQHQQQQQQHQHLHMVQQQQQRHQNGSSPVIKLEMDDSRSPFSSQNSLPGSLRPQTDGRKKEKRKYRASSLESSGSDASDAQVPSVSSTARGFKHPTAAMTPSNGPGSNDSGDLSCGEKQSKKKRKRCGECIGCMRKDNCASCAPCRNDKSHQICKMRRCEKLTEKKIKVSFPPPSSTSPSSSSPSPSIEAASESSEASEHPPVPKSKRLKSSTLLPSMY